MLTCAEFAPPLVGCRYYDDGSGEIYEGMLANYPAGGYVQAGLYVLT